MRTINMIMFAGLIAGTAATGCGDTINNIPAQQPAPNVVITGDKSADEPPLVCFKATDGKDELSTVVTVTRNDSNDTVPVAGGCIRITDTKVVYTALPGEIDGYIAPDSIQIAGAALLPNDVRTVTFVYRNSIDDRCLRVEDQYGNMVREARVYKAGLGREGYYGNGIFCGRETLGEEFEIDLDATRWNITSNTPNPVKLTGTLTTIVYSLRSSVNWCHYGVDLDGRSVRNAAVVMDDQWLSDVNCQAIETDLPHRAQVQGNYSTQGSSIYRVTEGAYAGREGETIRINRRLLWNESRTQWLQVELLPSHMTAEIFNGNLSIGWPQGRDRIVTELIPANETPDVKGAQGADIAVFDVTETRGQQQYNNALNYVALADASNNWLLCTRAYTTYGYDEQSQQYSSSASVDIHVDGVKQDRRDGRPSCTQYPVNSPDVTVRCQDRYQGSWLAKHETITVTATSAGHMVMAECEYNEQRIAQQQKVNVRVKVLGPNATIFDATYEPVLNVAVLINGQERYGYEPNKGTQWSMFPSDGIQSIWVSELHGTGLARPGGSFGIDPSDPAASGGQLMPDGVWEWTVRYTVQDPTNDPVGIACGNIIDHTGSRTDGWQWARFGTHGGPLFFHESYGQTCRYARVNEFLNVWPDRWYNGIRAPEPVPLPAGTLVENAARSYTLTYVPDQLAGCLRIQTLGERGVIYVNGGAVGRNVDFNTPVFVNVNRIPGPGNTEIVVRFDDVSGRRPPDIRINPASVPTQGCLDVTATY